MSWIFGYFGNKERQHLISPEPPLHSYKNSNLIIYCGGNKETVFFDSNPENSTCRVVTGLGLHSSGNGYKLLDNGDWNRYLNLEKVNVDKINGHFIAIKFSNNEMRIFTDELGLREIYVVELPKGFGFTTRIDWLKHFIQPEIDLKEFGSRWLLQNQISQKSILKNVNRIVCANAIIKNGHINIQQNSWQPQNELDNGRQLFEKSLVSFLSIKDKKISLSLSGGLDSRLLLSLLLNDDSENWDTHTFGDPEHPDSQIASQLLERYNRTNKIISDKLPSKEKIIELLNGYALSSAVTNPVSAILNLRYYDRLTDVDKTVIDGGFGEIWRREFANKLLFMGKKALLDKNTERVFELLTHTKANIFSEEVLELMKEGAIVQIENLIKELPDVSEIGSGNWIDLFSIRTRLPNYYAPEQARVDEYVVSFMPFAQKDLLKFLFTLKDPDKKNGQLFKFIINNNASRLTEIHLVKGNITHSFGSSSLNARLNARIKQKFGLYYKSKLKEELFKSIKDYVFDILRSSDVQNYGLYEKNKIKNIVEHHATDNNLIINELDWLLSFQLFRKGISK